VNVCRVVRQRGGSQELRERVSPPFADTKKPTVAFETRSAVEIYEGQIRRMPGGCADIQIDEIAD